MSTLNQGRMRTVIYILRLSVLNKLALVVRGWGSVMAARDSVFHNLPVRADEKRLPLGQARSGFDSRPPPIAGRWLGLPG